MTLFRPEESSCNNKGVSGRNYGAVVWQGS